MDLIKKWLRQYQMTPKNINRSTPLTAKQKLFCDVLTGNVNQTEAYQIAFNCSLANARGNACNLTKKPQVKRYLARLKK